MHHGEFQAFIQAVNALTVKVFPAKFSGKIIDRDLNIPIMRTRFAGVAQLVERNLAKVEVESSRLFSRSKSKGKLSRFPLIISACVSQHGAIAKRLCTGLQIRVGRFDSGSRLQIPARVVKLVDTTDLKSVAWIKPAYRFDSGSGHQTQ